jgi:hypothetical protein
LSTLDPPQIEKAKEANNRTQQMEGARHVMSSAFTFKKKVR